MSTECTIELLGGLRLRRGQESVTRFRTQKVGTLLAYLACFPRRVHAREELVELLWPESEPEAGRTSLRTALAALRRLLPAPAAGEEPLLLADRAGVRLNPAIVTTDVALLEAAVEAAGRAPEPEEQARHLARAIDLYRGPLLPGLYDQWVLQERERLEQLFLSALRRLAAARESAGDRDGAIQAALRAVSADPLAEAAHAALIRLYAAAGQPADALRQYRQLERVLREQLGQAPTAETRALIELVSSQKTPALVPPRPPVRPASRPPREPSLRAATAPGPRATPHLPLQLTRFFGRGEEVERVRALLCSGEVRLLTLTGPGGSGKTRLAIEAARGLADTFARAVGFVPLADLTDARLIPGAVAEAIGLQRGPDRDALEQIAEALHHRPYLLLLDNFEQLAAEGAAIVWDLLERAPELILLVTSRQPLRLGGEQEFPVPPLPVPDGHVAAEAPAAAPGPDTPPRTYTLYPSPDTLMHCPSVQLFVDRARAMRPEFQLTATNAATVAALCRRLDGIPLALELAAAWARVLTPAQMLARLESRFELLTSQRQDLPPRHRTLRGAIEASYRLLSPDLQRFFAGLSAFRGSWTLEAAGAVCGTENALGHLSELCDRSLVVAEASDSSPDVGMRYRLLESLRDYAADQLAPEERETLCRRHLQFFLHLAREAEQQLHGPDQAAWLEQLEHEHDNLRAALEGCLPTTAPGFASYPLPTAAGLELAGALVEFWEARGYADEGRRWLEKLLEQASGASAAMRAKALSGLALLTQYRGDFKRVQALYEQSLALSGEAGDRMERARTLRRMNEVFYMILGDPDGAIVRLEESLVIGRELGDPWGTAASLALLGNMFRDRGEDERAEALYEESLSLFRQLGDHSRIAQLLGDLGYMYTGQERYERARAVIEEALTLFRRLDGKMAITHTLWLLGRVAHAEGNYEQARALLEESVATGRDTPGRQAVANSLGQLGMLFEGQGDFAAARARYEECLALAREMGNRPQQAVSLRHIGRTAFHQGDFTAARAALQQSVRIAYDLGGRSIPLLLERLSQVAWAEQQAETAVLLFAAAQGMRAAPNRPLLPMEPDIHEDPTAAARAVLGPEAFAVTWERGRAMTVAEAVQLALAPADGPLPKK